jgi:DNA-binding CsgD family transcriptional regulator/PAS domain-containing protein
MMGEIIPEALSLRCSTEHEQIDELAGALREIVALMQGNAGLVAVQSKSTGQLVLLCADSALQPVRAERLLLAMNGFVPSLAEGEVAWHASPEDQATVLLLPVPPVPGHGRLVIMVLFKKLSGKTKQMAEDIYANRRPFAVGFFRLWQKNRALAARAQALEAVLDCTETGVIMIDRAAHVCFVNGAARTILRRGNGISCEQGILRAQNLAESVNLHAALSHLCVARGEQSVSEATAPLLTFRRKEAPPLVAILLPAHVAPVESEDVAAIMHIIDPVFDAEKMLSPLCRLYGLSRVETSLVCRLATGDALSEAAEFLRIREQTARGYLKQIFIKTGTKRQAQLIVLMLSSLMRIKQEILQEAMTPIGHRNGTIHFA